MLINFLDVHIIGTYPLMHHAGRLADPLNPFAKAIKEITNKQKKTDSDYAALYKAEWLGSLYSEDGRVVFPGANLESAMVDGGKKYKLGDNCKAGIFCDGNWPLIYEGPKDIDKLFEDGRFKDIRGARVKNGRVMRCRPIFSPWSLKFTLSYLPDLLNEKQIIDILGKVGQIIGIGDFTPKYGRFVVKSVVESKKAA